MKNAPNSKQAVQMQLFEASRWVYIEICYDQVVKEKIGFVS